MRNAKALAMRCTAGVAGGITAGALWATAAMAEVKYSEIVTPAKTEFEAALTAIFPFVGLVIGVLVGIAIVKRLAKAR